MTTLPAPTPHFQGLFLQRSFRSVRRRGPQCFVTRAELRPGGLPFFENEVPEIQGVRCGIVPWPAGSQSTVPARSGPRNQGGCRQHRVREVDPVGALHGARRLAYIQQWCVNGNIRGDKDRLIRWSADPGQYAIDSICSLEPRARVEIGAAGGHPRGHAPSRYIACADTILCVQEYIAWSIHNNLYITLTNSLAIS